VQLLQCTKLISWESEQKTFNQRRTTGTMMQSTDKHRTSHEWETITVAQDKSNVQHAKLFFLSLCMTGHKLFLHIFTNATTDKITWVKLPVSIQYILSNQAAQKIDALDQWCLQKLMGIKWYYHMPNDDVRWTTKQPHLSAVVQAWRFSPFGHIVWMPDETDAQKILTASPLVNQRRRPHTTWMKSIQ